MHTNITSQTSHVITCTLSTTHTHTHSLHMQAADVVQAIQKACRSASKGFKSRKISDSTFPRPKSSQAEAQRLPRPRMYMEDEEELLEYKKTPTVYNSSKKPLNRGSIDHSIASASSSPRTSGSAGDSMASRWKSGRRNMVGPRLSDGVFTREDRVQQLSSAIAKVRENNGILREKARYVDSVYNI